MTLTKNEIAQFNQIQGIASTNVPAYSNGDDEFFSVERHYFHGVFVGYKWQCVEFARRWLLIRKRCVFQNVSFAAHIWDEVSTIERVTDGRHFPLKTHPNGSPHEPQPDSILIYSQCNDLPFGHVAIICEVGPDYVRIAEQNYEFSKWSGNYARQLSLIQKNGLYYIEDEYPVSGWMEIEDNHQLEPLDESKMDAILKHYQQPRPAGTIERCYIPNKNIDLEHCWLDKNCPAEKYFMELFGEDIARANAEVLPYYKVDFDLLLNIGTTSNELHRMFIKATNHVIYDDELMARFGIPEIFWLRIRSSWENDQDLLMTGRFDLAFDGQHLKVFEYNADSASALIECAIIQQKWAKAVKLDSEFMSGFQMHRVLVQNWKNFNIKTRIHLLIDDDQDEMLTALYMQNVMNDAGIETKLCILTKDFYWKDSIIVDDDGQIVTFVWKLWMWETVFIDYADAQKERNLDGKTTDRWIPINGEHPRLSDILLNDQIKVVEPLWKVITSNKALLPVLWSMFPNHPNLLRSEWTLSNELKRKGYAKKPIVGRCGHNVTLYNIDGDSVIDETTGKFIDRNCIYQELFHLRNFDGYYGIIGSWIVHGLFTGFCIREDQKLITDAESPVTACCIVRK